MQTGYGPALLLGVLIGGAILLDDVITPERKGPPPRVAMFHHGEGMESVKNLPPGGDHNVWVIKGGDPCLLYTSPSPRDGLLSRMPSSA